MSRKIWLIIILGIFLLIFVPVLIILFVWNVGGTQNGANSGKFSSTVPGITSPETNSSQLAFVSFMDDDLALYTVNTDGTQLTRLTQEKMLVMNPVWSPDGNRIAFEACLGGSMATDCPPGGSLDIFTVETNEPDLIDITNDPSMDRFPSWSPTGERIAFSSDRSGKDQIYVMNADGSGVKQLTDGQTRDYEPHWSADGTWLAYMCAQDLDSHICILRADGSSPVTTLNGTNPVWSPVLSEGGERLAFHCFSSGHSDICIANPDGTNLIKLTNTPADEITPSWSPDGNWIAFQSNQYNDVTIYKISISSFDNTTPVRLTGSNGSAHWPAWSPDGTQIAFLLDSDLYVMGSDGSGQRLLAGDVVGIPIWYPKFEVDQSIGNVSISTPPVKTTPTGEAMAMTSWDQLIDPNLVADVNWTLYTGQLEGELKGNPRTFAISYPSQWVATLNPTPEHFAVQNVPETNGGGVAGDFVKLEIVPIKGALPEEGEGEPYRVRLSGEMGTLRINVTSPGQALTIGVTLEKDGVYYILSGYANLPEADQARLDSYQAMLLSMLASFQME